MKPCETNPDRFIAADASDLDVRSAVADCYTCPTLAACFDAALREPPVGRVRAAHVWVSLETRVLTAVPMPPEEFLPARRAAVV